MLATIETIREVRQHPNADRLDIAQVLGYECIVGRDAYIPGDVIILIQPDAVLPADRAWAAESLKYTSRGRVNAAKLRKLWSMGLVMPTSILTECWSLGTLVSGIEPEIPPPGTEVSDLLGITKYEPPLPKDIKAKGGLPFGIPKTDEDRWQNVRDLDSYLGQPVDVTLKIDGSSFTAFCALPGDHPGSEPLTGITSRTLELKTDIEGTNPWIEAARLTALPWSLANYCQEHGVSLALRGEVYGAGVQAMGINPHSREPRGVAFFGVWNVRERRYEGRESPHYYRNVCQAIGLPAVPLVEEDALLSREILTHYGDLLEEIDGKPFEGVVIKGADFSFKIMNKYYDSRK